MVDTASSRPLMLALLPLHIPFPTKCFPHQASCACLADLPVKSSQFLLYAHPEFSSLCLASQAPPVGSAPWAPQTSSLLLRQWDLQEHNLKTTTTNDQRASLDCGTLHFQLPGSSATWWQTHNINKIITALADLQTLPQTSCHLTLLEATICQPENWAHVATWFIPG